MDVRFRKTVIITLPFAVYKQQAVKEIAQLFMETRSLLSCLQQPTTGSIIK